MGNGVLWSQCEEFRNGGVQIELLKGNCPHVPYRSVLEYVLHLYWMGRHWQDVLTDVSQMMEAKIVPQGDSSVGAGLDR